jgi:hypothetical protein
VAPVMRASLPLRGIGVYVPAKDSDISGQGVDVLSLSVKIGGDEARIRLAKNGEEARKPV